MHIEACANCLVHGWKQPEDSSTLLQCQNCKLILYCSKECQTEHWIKIHRHHCEHFKDPTKNEQWQHKEQDCLICQEAVAAGVHNLTQEENPYYNCMHSMFNCGVAVLTHSMRGAYEVNGLFQQLTPNCYHPHPFPVTGDPGDLREKALIVLWHLVDKFQLIHSNVVLIYEDDFMEVETKIVEERFGIWFNKKIYPQPLAEFSCNNLEEMLYSIELKMETSDMDDPFKLWKIIKLVAHIEHEVDKSNMSQFFKDPQTNLPDDLKELVSDGMNNITQFLTVANDVLEALAIKVVPYQEVLKIL